jgi:hypothetical protein
MNPANNIHPWHPIMRKNNPIVRALLAMCITGGIMTCSLHIFAAGDGGKPAAVQTVKNGLSVTVVSGRAVYATNEIPTFDVKFTNLRDSGIRLTPGINMYDMWTITAEDTATGASFRVHSTAEYRRRVLETTTFGPKESKSVHLDFSKFQFIHLQQEQKENPRAILPPGKYRLTIAMKFEAIFDVPEAVKPAVWVGEFETDAVMFEIAGK